MRIKKFAAVVLCCAPALALTGCSKPAEADVYDAVVKLLEDQGASSEQATAYADCATPKMHDRLSSTALENLIENGEGAEGTDDDVKEAEAIDKECTDEVMGSTPGS